MLRIMQWLVSFGLVLSPVAVVAAGANAALKEDVLNSIEKTQTEPAVAVPSPDRMQSGGGGTMDSKSLIYPGPYGGGITVDASITKEVKPDFVAINAYCDSGKKTTREEARTALQKVFLAIKATAGKDAKVRRASVGVSPYYDPSGGPTEGFMSSMNVLVRLVNVSAAQKLSDAIEDLGCSVNWDVRLQDPQDYELSIVDTLLSKLETRKKVFEKLLGKKLTKVSGASLYTWLDGYSSYDPETNMAEATTTLSVTFDTGTRTTLPVPVPMTK